MREKFMRYKYGIVVLLSVTILFTLCSCNAAAPETAPAAPASEQDEAAEPEGTGAFDYVNEVASQSKELSGNIASENIDLKKTLPEPPEARPALYTDDFTKAVEYADYGRDGKAMTGDEICVEGYVDSLDEEHHSLILITDQGSWAVSVGELGTENFYRLVDEAVGQYVRVFGKFTGYNDELSMPGIAFLPREFQYRPYRLESYDNTFRLTQLDYVFREPVYNTERTYGKITYKEPSAWKPELTEDTLYYRAFDNLPAVILAHHEKVKESGFDEINNDDSILSELASSYVQDGGEILSKQSFKLNGYSALRFETTWEDEELPMPICMYCYMFIVDDEYYYFGTQEPYLVGESVKRALEEMLKNIEVSEASSEEPSKEDKDKETKETKEAGDNTKEKDTKAEEAADDKAAADEKKNKVPTKAEIQGKTFTQSITANFVGKENNETYTESEDLPDTIVTAQDLAKYDESTGRVTIHENENGMIMTMVLTFSYDSSGRIVYSGDLAIDDPRFIASGTVSGHMK